MNYTNVLKYLSPCGLDCGRCADFEDSDIKKSSTELLQLLGNYSRLAKLKAAKNPVFDNYSCFKEILTSFSNASCSGCRGENVLCPLECTAKDCLKEKNIDFCFQCEEYPCEKQFSGRENLRKRWLNVNNRMKDIGVVQYYIEQQKLPRY